MSRDQCYCRGVDTGRGERRGREEEGERERERERERDMGIETLRRVCVRESCEKGRSKVHICIDGKTGGREDGRTGGREDGRTGGREDGRMGGREVFFCVSPKKSSYLKQSNSVLAPGRVNSRPPNFLESATSPSLPKDNSTACSSLNCAESKQSRNITSGVLQLSPSPRG
jgi:hypothetical protein